MLVRAYAEQQPSQAAALANEAEATKAENAALKKELEESATKTRKHVWIFFMLATVGLLVYLGMLKSIATPR
ncbi:hypothetical protein HXX76_001009 [Chlamydomonas incerta]|uniref:Uncharacterized protein n=1 Tax=Chlamydomonas incerta TaxID=51695 RepID=A0A835WBI1_CHLIN|nr:hypothetical protein HXX76_001009 [Chlamydomonas incerta]|eukprot:KAG2444252.1 hypothetical protein HXX76_001009 [Chlamydomonas incerta]